jgi:spore coat protein CotH
MRNLLGALFFTACTPHGARLASTDSIHSDDSADVVDSATDSSSDTSPDSIEESPADTSRDTTARDTSDPVEVVPDAGDPSDVLFDLDRVHSLDITMPEDTFTALMASVAYTAGDYHPADIVYDGERLTNVGIRLKGRWGSWRPLSQKAAFKIDTNRYVEGQTLRGLKKLTINNMIVDCSFNREQMAFHVLRELGMPASRTGYVWVTVNGMDYGLYLNVESVDDTFLERNFAEPDGNLYEADYIIWPGGSYTLVDFILSSQDYFTLSEGEDVGLADVYAVTDAMRTTVGTPDFFDTVGALIDFDHHQRMIAAELWLGHIDGYSMNVNNYKPYFDPIDGKLRILPWDFDYGFLDEADWGFSWRSPSGIISRTCLRDITCRSGTIARIEETLDAIDAMELAERLEQGIELTRDYITADPRKECSPDSTRTYQDSLRNWITARRPHIEVEWAL